MTATRRQIQHKGSVSGLEFFQSGPAASGDVLPACEIPKWRPPDGHYQEVSEGPEAMLDSLGGPIHSLLKNSYYFYQCQNLPAAPPGRETRTVRRHSSTGSRLNFGEGSNLHRPQRH